MELEPLRKKNINGCHVFARQPCCHILYFFRMKASGFAHLLPSGLPFQSPSHKFYQKQRASLANVKNSNNNAIAMNLFSSVFLPYICFRIMRPKFLSAGNKWAYLFLLYWSGTVYNMLHFNINIRSCFSSSLYGKCIQYATSRHWLCSYLSSVDNRKPLM